MAKIRKKHQKSAQINAFSLQRFQVAPFIPRKTCVETMMYVNNSSSEVVRLVQQVIYRLMTTFSGQLTILASRYCYHSMMFGTQHAFMSW